MRDFPVGRKPNVRVETAQTVAPSTLLFLKALRVKLSNGSFLGVEKLSSTYHLLSANLYRWSSAGTTSIRRIYLVLGFSPVTFTLKLGNMRLRRKEITVYSAVWYFCPKSGKKIIHKQKLDFGAFSNGFLLCARNHCRLHIRVCPFLKRPHCAILCTIMQLSSGHF